jgi:hypothetical protein
MTIGADELNKIIKNSLLAVIDLTDNMQVYDVLYPIKGGLFLLFNVNISDEGLFVGGTKVSNEKYIELIDASIINFDEFVDVYVNEEGM